MTIPTQPAEIYKKQSLLEYIVFVIGYVYKNKFYTALKKNWLC